jgi:ABC-type transport system involved in cytochrome c biogenesis permease subunit
MQAVPLVFYAVAAVAYVVHFAGRSPLAGRAATTVLGGGALAHAFVIGMQTMEFGHVPFAGTTQAISTFVWLFVLAYLFTEVTVEERGMGVFVAPLAVGVQLVPAFGAPGLEPRSELLESPMFWTHVSAMLFSYASFALAAVISVTYLLLFKEIKAKHLGFFYTRLPSLQTLDVMNSRAVVIGWCCLTAGLVIGTLWALQARALALDDPRVEAMSIVDPKILAALITWVVYTFQLTARRALGWRGRRAAWLSALGFTIVLLNFLPVSYFLTRTHNFY